MPGNAPLRLSVPSSINMYLRDYQRDGVAFFFRQYAQNQGGILGDDMVQPLSPPLWLCREGHCLLNERFTMAFSQQGSKQATKHSYEDHIKHASRGSIYLARMHLHEHTHTRASCHALFFAPASTEADVKHSKAVKSFWYCHT